ncbi:MAG: tetratricopeptide repeat protein [Bacteroidales bacterium]
MPRITKPVVVALLLFFTMSARLFAQDLNAAIKLTKSEQFAPAATMFKQLIRQTPANGDLYYYYGRNCMEKYNSDTMNVSFQEKADSARAIFEQGISQDPANPLNLVGLGGLKMITKDLAGSKAEFDKALALFPSKANKSIQMAPERQAKVLIQMAESYVIAGNRDTASAFTFLRRAEKLDNKNPELYIVKGDLYFYLLNDGSRGISNYNEAQRLEPKSPEAKLKIGQLWLRARRYAAALEFYQDVVKMDSTFAPAYRELGLLLSRVGRKEEAKKNFYKFLELSRNTAARKQFVNILIELKDYPEAINQLYEIRKVDITDNDVNRALAYSYFETQKYDSGLIFIRKFMASAKPEKIRAQDYIYYGRLLAKTKQDSLATLQLMKAYDLDTSKVELISEAALCYSKLKKYDKAKDLYERRIQMNKGSAMDFYSLGKVYYSLSDYVKADTSLAIFNSMQPDYIPGWVWHARVKTSLDPDSKLGLAKPLYETILERTQPDTAKYASDRTVSYSYLSYYFYVQYIDTKARTSAIKAMAYAIKVLNLDPKDEKAIQILDNLTKNIGIFKIGMAKADMIRVIGNPTATTPATGAAGPLEILTYDELKISIAINDKGMVEYFNFLK